MRPSRGRVLQVEVAGRAETLAQIEAIAGERCQIVGVSAGVVRRGRF